MSGYNPTFTSEELANETWKPVPEYEDSYSVSTLGRVRRDSAYRSTKPGRLLLWYISKSGYAQVRLSKPSLIKSLRVHRVVLLAFVGEPEPDRYGVNHIDGNKLNNQLSNLEYASAMENKKHAKANGLVAKGKNHGSQTKPGRVPQGECHHRASVTKDKVKQIRQMIADGIKQNQIAKMLNVTTHLVSRINTGKTWKSV